MKQIKKIRIGSRESRLAVIQSHIVMEQIRKSNPEIQLELVTMKTTGDIFLDKSLDKIGGKGLFLKELEQALRSGKIDLAVHSLKDMPMELAEDLPVVAYSTRQDPRDVLVLPEGVKQLERNTTIGCSSRRRKLQLEMLYPGIRVSPVRGNVLTRLEKLDRGEYGALVLAAAGMKRLGLKERISRYYTAEEILPAAGQGILAVQGRAGEDYSYLNAWNCPETQQIALCERAFVKVLDGGCSSPVAAYASCEKEQITVTGLYYDEASGLYAIRKKTGMTEQAAVIGRALAEEFVRGEIRPAEWRQG